MIRIIDSLQQLDFFKLTELYSEDIEHDRWIYYPHLEYFEGIRQTEMGLYAYLRDCFFTENKGYFILNEEQRDYVSGVRFEPYRDGLLLNALMTAPSYRGMGYASMLLTYAFSHIDVACNGPVYSHVYMKNLPSVYLHEKFGFRKMLDYAILLDGSVRTDHITYIKEK